MSTFKEWLRDQENITTFSKIGVGSSVYHKGSVESPQQIDPFRPAIKQNKRNRDYGGFYVGDLHHAQMYPGESTLELNINPNAKVLLGGMVDRIRVPELISYANQGIDMIWGKDIRGENQGLILNKQIITGFKKLN